MTTEERIKEIDKKLIEAQKKLHNSDNIVVQHRLVQEIDRLLDERILRKK